MTNRSFVLTLAAAGLFALGCSATPSVKKGSSASSTGGGSTSSGLIGGNLSASTGSTNAGATQSTTTGGVNSSGSQSAGAVAGSTGTDGFSAGLGSTGAASTGDSGSTGSTAAASTAGSTNTAGTTGGATTGAGSTSGGTTGPACDPGTCYDLCQYVGAGNDSCCCNGYADANGFCNTNPDSCFAGSTNTTSSGGSTGGSGGTTGTGCGIECQHAGFHCQNGQCVLNGNDGSLQITLKWQNNPRTDEDLDLHVIEPGGCEIYYGNRHCIGDLDLDENAACNITDPVFSSTTSELENVIYASGVTPPSGQYTVRVDFWESCSHLDPVNYQVIIRKGSQTTTVPGVFHLSNADQGGPGSGFTIATFSYP